MSISDLPLINVSLNAISAALLMSGYIAIKGGNKTRHRAIMIAALCSSTLFLISYLIYHYNVGSIPYSRYDWTRPVYFTILIPHIVLAALVVPFIIAAVYQAVKQNFTKHRRLVRWVWPTWIFVSLSGIAVYLMLYHL